jgi:hypothetical protein
MYIIIWIQMHQIFSAKQLWRKITFQTGENYKSEDASNIEMVKKD